MRRDTVHRYGAVLGSVLLVGCSSSGTRSTPPTSAGSRSGAATSPSGGSAVDAGTRAAITKAYETFFSSTSRLAQSEAALQHGAAFAAALKAEGESDYAKNSSAVVTAIKLAGPDVADVTFSIKQGSSVLLADGQGKAVRENGAWKVAAQTFCALLGLAGTPPKQCKDPSLVALPR